MGNAICARVGAYEVDVVEGETYWWCSCGRSKTQPFCDGKHDTENTGCEPVEYVAQANLSLPMCGCKRSKTPPICDGSHEVEDFSALAT